MSVAMKLRALRIELSCAHRESLGWDDGQRRHPAPWMLTQRRHGVECITRPE